MFVNVGDKIRIRCKDRQITIEVIYVWGKDIIGFNRKRKRFYATFWDEYKDRKRQKFSLNKRHWREYSDLYSLKRFVKQAITKASEITIDQLMGLQEIARQYHLQLLICETNEFDNLTAPPNFNQIIGSLRGVKKRKLKIAKETALLCFSVKDSLGRTNVGALCAKLTAINNLLAGRLQDIFSWLPHYAARLEALELFQKNATATLKSLQTSFSACLRHRIFANGESLGRQKENLIAALKSKKESFSYWQGIQPFDSWADFCQQKLDSALKQIEKNQFEEAKESIIHIIESIKFKKIQLQVADLLEQLDLDFLLKTLDFLSYENRIIKLKITRGSCKTFSYHDFNNQLATAAMALRLGKIEEAKSALKDAYHY